MLIHGGCHCGNISFKFAFEGDADAIQARVCDCAFCTKHGGVWTSNPAASLAIDIKQASRVAKYSFGTSTAVFHICSDCGVVPVVTSEIEGHLYGIVSVNAFNDLDPSSVQRAPASFEGESVDSRLARRTRNWIADVRVVEAA
jgi:hypothetical protein